MKNIVILGSTGSIGKNALDVARRFPGRFKVSALSANSNIELLLRQIREFRPYCVCVRDKEAACRIAGKLGRGIKLFAGKQGLPEMVRGVKADRVLLAISGAEALSPLLAAIDSRKDVALANKEALVMAGSIIMSRAREKKVRILPIDSEQSAIWQCLSGEDPAKLKRIYLTASGGPFLKLERSRFKNITRAQVLRHPRWKMGKKITVDSATLVNKGLELIEAMFLFEVGVDKIKILMHPEAIIHSMVEFVDGVTMAQLSATDMRIPIQYALTYPERAPGAPVSFDFYKLGAMHFEKPDFSRFPSLGLAYRAAGELGTLPAVFNAANEVGVEGFLGGRVNFVSIVKVTEAVMKRHRNVSRPSLGAILEADAWAREEASSFVSRMD